MSGSVQTGIREVVNREELQSSAKFFGSSNEETLCERFPLELERNSYFDATIHAERDPYQTFDTDDPIDLMEKRGTKVQMKAVLEWVKSGSNRRRGRYRLWLPDHRKLIQDDGVYLFTVYDPSCPRPIQKLRWIRARELEQEVGGITWMNASHSTKAGKPANVVHTRVFPDE